MMFDLSWLIGFRSFLVLIFVFQAAVRGTPLHTTTKTSGGSVMPESVTTTKPPARLVG